MLKLKPYDIIGFTHYIMRDFIIFEVIMKKKKSIVLNYIYNASYQVLTIIIPLITTPYLSRVLKADGIGTYSATASIVAFFTLFAALGTIIYGNREISYVSSDRELRSRTFWEIEILSIITDSVCLIAYLIFLYFCNEDFSIYAIQIFSLLSVAANVSWLFQGMEDFRKVTIRNTIFKLLSVVFIFVFVKSKSDLFLYVAGLVILDFLNNLSIWFYLPKYIDKPDWKNLHPLRHLGPTFALFVPTIASSIYTIFDKTMLKFFTDTSFENGYYEQALKLSKTALTLITALEAVMIPRIGALFSANKKKEMTSLLYQSYRFVLMLGFPLCFGLIGIAYNFVPWFYGDGYDSVKYLLIILSFLIPIIGLSNVTGIQYLITTRRENIVSITVTIGAICNIILNLILIPKMYSYGAAISSVFAELLITALQMFYVRKEISSLKVFTSSWKYLFASILMLALLVFENNFLTSSILNTFVMIFSGVVLYTFVLLSLRDEALLIVVKFISKKISLFNKK